MTADHPFQPGTKVLIHSGHSSSRRCEEGEVEKVYKTGRFKVKGRADQWRPYEPTSYRPFWHAASTVRSWTGGSDLTIWDESTDAMVRKRLGEQDRRNRYRTAMESLNKMMRGLTPHAMGQALTEEAVAALEQAVAAVTRAMKTEDAA